MRLDALGREWSRRPQSSAKLVSRSDVVAVAESGCWVWLLYKMPNGYGLACADGRRRLAHRIFYEQLRGPIPNDMVIDHLCRNRACVNPEHMEVVTTRENLIRGVGFTGVNAHKTHCVRGHEFTEATTCWRKPASPTSKPTRSCRVCGRENAALYRRRASSKEDNQ